MERAYWRACWKKKVEPVRGDPPPWEYIDLHYYIRKKDFLSLREKLNELAVHYPQAHTGVWGGTRKVDGKPFWKWKADRFLKWAGDPLWESWEPTFKSDTLDWDPHEFREFAARFNPGIPQLARREDALPLAADRVAIHLDRVSPPTSPISIGRPLFSAGGSMWFCQPAPGENLTAQAYLLAVPLNQLLTPGQEVLAKARVIDWPVNSADGKTSSPGEAVRCWLATVENRVATVWIGTAGHGLARFEFREGRWQSRWYAAREGVPGEDILVVRPCLHEGKAKLLILSENPRPFTAQEWTAISGCWIRPVDR